MMKKFVYKILFLFLISFVFTNSKQLYSTIQMMDQIMIIDPNTLQIDQSIPTEFNDNEEIHDCPSYIEEIECNMSSGCEWTMGMCMEIEDSEDCIGYSEEMECNMSSGCEWMMDMCMDSMMDNGINTPHFIALDETNGYWFITTIASGYIAQYSLLDNSFIDSYFVGDAPALLAVDSMNKKIYCSRMMPMNGMGNMMPSSNSNIIQGLNYSAMGLSESPDQLYEINSPAPHGLAINNDGSELYTASNTADWLYKINTSTGEVDGVIMDDIIGNPPDQTTQRLKPIQCLSAGSKLFVSCSAGLWMNPFTGEQSVVEGQLQMWNSNEMVLIDTIELGEHTAPWHIKESPVDDLIYVVLGGDNIYETEGVAAVRYSDENLSLEWIVNDPSFDTLHGIDVSENGEKIYVSGRGDGKIHIFDFNGNYIDNLFLGSMTMLGGIALEKNGLPDIGDINNDNIFNVVDVVLAVNAIFYPMMNSPYQSFASDYNEDSLINVVDIVLIVELILSQD